MLKLASPETTNVGDLLGVEGAERESFQADWSIAWTAIREVVSQPPALRSLEEHECLVHFAEKFHPLLTRHPALLGRLIANLQQVAELSASEKIDHSETIRRLAMSQLTEANKMLGRVLMSLRPNAVNELSSSFAKKMLRLELGLLMGRDLRDDSDLDSLTRWSRYALEASRIVDRALRGEPDDDVIELPSLAPTPESLGYPILYSASDYSVIQALIDDDESVPPPALVQRLRNM